MSAPAAWYDGWMRDRRGAGRLLLVTAALAAGCGGSAASSRAAPPAGHDQDPGAEEGPPPGAGSVLSRLAPARLDPDDEQQMREVAGASAPRVYFVGLLPLLAATGGSAGSELDEGTCPARIERGELTLFRGGCTDADGSRWTGSATVRGLDARRREGDVTYRGFGFEKTHRCPDGERPSVWRADGRFLIGASAFEIDVAFVGEGVDERCRPMLGTGGLDYRGRALQTGDAVRWSGEGRYGWEGFGVVEARTEDELLNRRNCEHEALMGSTTVRSGEVTVTFTYDGADDCDEESTVQLSVGGQPRGELSGVACGAGGGGGAAPWLLAPLLWLLRGPSRGRPCRSRRSA